MSDAAWIEGMTQLVLAYFNADEAHEAKAARGKLFRQHLNFLTDEMWLYAVRSAIESDTFPPTIARLKEFAASCPPPEHAYLPAPRIGTDEERREAVRRGIARVAEAAAECGNPIHPPSDHPGEG
jgi:hypothetical protein